MLRPGGQLVISDVMRDAGSSGAEIVRLLKFAATHGFLINAFVNGVRETIRYFGARGSAKLEPTPADLLAQLAEQAGFEFDTLAENLSYRTDRYAARLTPRETAAT